MPSVFFSKNKYVIFAVCSSLKFNLLLSCFAEGGSKKVSLRRSAGVQLTEPTQPEFRVTNPNARDPNTVSPIRQGHTCFYDIIKNGKK